MTSRTTFRTKDVGSNLRYELACLELILSITTNLNERIHDIGEILNRIASFKNTGVGSNQLSRVAYIDHFSRITALVLLAYTKNEVPSLAFVKKLLDHWEPLIIKIPRSTRNKALEENKDAFIAFGKKIADVGNGKLQYEMVSIILRYLQDKLLSEQEKMRQFFDWLPDIAEKVQDITDLPFFTKTKSLLAAINEDKGNVISFQPYAVYLGQECLRGTKDYDLWIDFNRATFDFIVFFHPKLLGLNGQERNMVYASIDSNQIVSQRTIYFRQHSHLLISLRLKQCPTTCNSELDEYMEKMNVRSISIISDNQKDPQPIKRIINLLPKWLKIPKLDISTNDDSMSRGKLPGVSVGQEDTELRFNQPQNITELLLPETESSCGQRLVKSAFNRDSEDMIAYGIESRSAIVACAVHSPPDIAEDATNQLPEILASRQKQQGEPDHRIAGIHPLNVSDPNGTMSVVNKNTTQPSNQSCTSSVAAQRNEKRKLNRCDGEKQSDVADVSKRRRGKLDREETSLELTSTSLFLRPFNSIPSSLIYERIHHNINRSVVVANAALEEAVKLEDQPRPTMPLMPQILSDFDAPDPCDELRHVAPPDWDGPVVTLDLIRETLASQQRTDVCLPVSRQTYSGDETNVKNECNLQIVNTSENVNNVNKKINNNLSVAFVQLQNEVKENIKRIEELQNRLHSFGLLIQKNRQ